MGVKENDYFQKLNVLKSLVKVKGTTNKSELMQLLGEVHSITDNSDRLRID